MKRIVYTKIGGPDSIEIISEKLEQAVDNEVKVRVYRAGINFADLMMRQGLYGTNPDFPFTPGYEVSGIITEIGDNVENLKIGDRVIAMTGFGGYAEEVIIGSNRIIPIPNNMSFDQAAAMPVTYGTAYHMLVHLGGIKEGDSILIHHAAGGVGTAAAQICKSFGAEIIIGTASKSKKEFVESMGMYFVDRDSEDFVKVCKKLTNGKGVHQAIDPVAGKHLMKSYNSLRNGGKLHCFGAFYIGSYHLAEFPPHLSLPKKTYLLNLQPRLGQCKFDRHQVLFFYQAFPLNVIFLWILPYYFHIVFDPSYYLQMYP